MTSNVTKSYSISLSPRRLLLISGLFPLYTLPHWMMASICSIVSGTHPYISDYFDNLHKSSYKVVLVNVIELPHLSHSSKYTNILEHIYLPERHGCYGFGVFIHQDNCFRSFQ